MNVGVIVSHYYTGVPQIDSALSHKDNTGNVLTANNTAAHVPNAVAIDVKPAVSIAGELDVKTAASNGAQTNTKQGEDTVSLVSYIGLKSIKDHAIAGTPEDKMPPPYTYNYRDFYTRQIRMMNPTARGEYENAAAVITEGERSDYPKGKEGAPSIISESTWSDIPLIIGDRKKGDDPLAFNPSVATRLNQRFEETEAKEKTKEIEAKENAKNVTASTSDVVINVASAATATTANVSATAANKPVTTSAKDTSAANDNNNKKAVENTRTSTKVGKLFFQARLGRPTDNVEVIRKRQSALKALMSSKTLQQTLSEQLKIIGENEKHPESYWHRVTVLPGRTETKYCRTDTCLDDFVNDRALLLDLHWAKEMFYSGTVVGTQTANVPMMTASVIDQTGVVPEGNSQTIQKYVSKTAVSAGGVYTLMLMSGYPAIQAIGAAALAISNAWFLRQNMGYVWADFKNDALFHEKLLATARTYKAMKALHTALASTDLAKNLEHFKKLDDFLKNPDLQNLFGKLESRTFNNPAKFFFRRGPVLGAWKQMERKEVKTAFAKAFYAVAEIDTVLATASLVKDSNEKPDGTKFCFPTFIDTNQNESYVDIQEGWNPLVAKNVVTNSMQLGTKFGKPNLVITGANAGGKSTAIKQVMLTAIMGQSLGIAPASKVETTIFNHIISAMQSKDNMGGGDSLFQSQVKTITEIDDKLKTYPNARMLVALDETFNSTQPTKGAALAQAAMEKLVSYRNNMLLFATHFLNVPRAAAKMAGVVPVQFAKDPSTGKFTYKMTDGITTDRHAFEAAKNLGMNSEMLEKAATIESTLKMDDL